MPYKKKSSASYHKKKNTLSKKTMKKKSPAKYKKSKTSKKAKTSYHTGRYIKVNELRKRRVSAAAQKIALQRRFNAFEEARLRGMKERERAVKRQGEKWDAFSRNLRKERDSRIMEIKRSGLSKKAEKKAISAESVRAFEEFEKARLKLSFMFV